MTVIANLEAYEGIAGAEEIINLARRSRRITVTNDSVSDLSFKMNTSENYMTLKGTESLTFDATTPTIIIKGNGAYRIWVFG